MGNVQSQYVAAYVVASVCIGCTSDQADSPAPPRAKNHLLPADIELLERLRSSSGVSYEVVDANSEKLIAASLNENEPLVKMELKGRRISSSQLADLAELSLPSIVRFDHCALNDFELSEALLQRGSRVAGFELAHCTIDDTVLEWAGKHRAIRSFAIEASAADTPSKLTLTPLIGSPQLVSLRLNGCAIDAAHLDRVIAGSPLLSVDLFRSTVQGVHQWKCSPKVVRHLNLRDAQVPASFVERFVECRDMETVDLGGVPVGDRELAGLLPKWEELKVLGVRDTNVTDASIAVVGRARVLAALDLRGCKVDAKSWRDVEARIHIKY